MRLAQSIGIIFLALVITLSCNGGSSGSGSNTPDTGALALTQFGITWTFDKQYQTGQFANGDYWVFGPVTIVSINPPSSQSGGRTINGSMLNPSPTQGETQGYDSAMYDTYGPYYNSALNVALNVSAQNPLSVPAGSSLVSTISEAEAGYRPQLKTAAILTVLSSAPADGSFRPPYCGTDKTIHFNKSNLDYTKLASLVPVVGTPNITDVEAYFEKPWIDHVPNWLGRYHHPTDNMPDYGREMAGQISVGALMLNLNYTNAQKEKLLVRFVQLGIDFYGVIQDGGQNNWPPNGGHESGRKWPILFASIMLGNSGMGSIGQSATVQFGEDGQTFYIAQSDINLVHNPDTRTSPAVPYAQGDLGLPEWGIVHSNDPTQDNNHWETVYRQCCTALSWNGFVLAAHIMNAKSLWNHDALFDYQDRYMQVSSSGGAYPGWRSWDSFTEHMWDTYRANYGTVWTAQ